jgi:uncharacterized membrane protein (DUF4010 family)
MTEYDLFLRLGLALAIGFSVGLERGWQEREEEEGQRTAGLRTFALIGLLGGLLGVLSRDGNTLILAVGIVTIGIVLGAFMMREGVKKGDFGATSFIAALLTLSLGAYAVLGNPSVAAGVGVTMIILLAYKPLLHRWLKRMTWSELRAGLVLAAMTFILLPLLPGRTIDPWGAVNPYQLWLMTVLIAAVSFAGYTAIKSIGPERGTVLAAAAGGMVSSTAVTLTLARMARQNPERVPLLAGSILVAGVVMFIRVLIIAAIINAGLAVKLAPSLLASQLAMGIAAGILVRHDDGEGAVFNLKNPFELPAVLRFGLLLSIIIVLVFAVRQHFGERGLLFLAAISGLADVDAVTLSVSRLGEISATAVEAVLLAVFVNTFAKAIYAWWTGGAAIGLRVTMGSLFSAVVGTAVILLLPA